MKYIFIFLLSLILSLLLTPLAKAFSLKLNILDQPGHRKIHAKPVPLLGGPVIFISFASAFLFSGFEVSELSGILAIGLMLIIFGLLDDTIVKVLARYKIWAHLVLSFIFIYLTNISFGLFQPDFVNWVVTACFITFMTNSMNMLDGMDGLVSGVCFIASVFFFILAFNNNQPAVALIAIAIAGTTLGFLKYNFNPASIFLGEAGSTFLGFLMAVISIKLEVIRLWDIALILNIERLQIVSFVVPLVILGIPIFDTFFVFLNRFFHHVKFSTPGKDHSHHRIHLMGLSQKATVLIVYCVQIVLGSIALTMASSNFQQFLSLLLIVFVLAAFAWIFLTRVEVYTENRRPQ
jgi:UDP-GlcNAc:undecaprenyl-phosphate GlcNAc-1-phosphate transferase